MMRFLVGALIPAIIVVGGIFLLLLWLNSGPAVNLEQRLPGSESAEQAIPPEPPVDIEGFHVPGEGEVANLPGAWYRFRGPNFDAVSTETVPLLRNFPEEGPLELWSLDLGEGYAGAAVLRGRVYVLDYDQKAGADTLRCLSLEDGKEIWRRGYYVRVKRSHGMSRTVPAVTDKYVVTIGPKCHVLSCDAQTGAFRWGIDLVKEYGATVPQWYTGQCPVIDNDRVIIAPGGTALMIAADCESGEIIWETPNPNSWKMTHSSIMPMTLNGRRMYVYCASGGVVGVSAETGEILWECDSWTVKTANIPSPVIVGDGRIFLTGGYGAGSMMIQIAEQQGAFSVEELFRLKSSVFGSQQQTPIFYNHHIYGVKGNGELICLDLEGNVMWRSGRNLRFGKKGYEPYMIADGVMLLMDDEGQLSMVRAAPEGFQLLGQAYVLAGEDPWGPMALAGGRLIVRDLTYMVCLDLRASSYVQHP